MVPRLNAEDAAAVIASLPPTATDAQRAKVVDFAHTGFNDHPRLLDKWARQAKASLSPSTVSQISLLLSILGTRPGCLALTGRIGPFQALDHPTRESILLSWLSSPIGTIQKAAAGLKGITLIVFYRHYQPAWEAIGYEDGRPTDWKNAPGAEEETPAYPYKFENEKVQAQPAEVKVLVVDKGIYLHPNDMNGREDDGYTNLYDGEGLLPTEDGSLNVLAGSTFGGGTTINWSASLKPRAFLRQAWAEKHGIPYFRSPLFTEDLNAVATRMGAAHTKIQHNVSNSLLALGAQRAGMPCDAVPQNTGGHVHYCGKCQFGCISGHKQGGTVTWLKDAAETGNAAFMTNCFVERILFDKSGRKAVGALAKVDGRKVTIHANRSVVVSSGSIQTPAILLRTPELKFNKQIGQHLHLHPTTVVTGYYNFPVKPWEGGLLTMVVNGSELVDPEGWGAKIEVIASSPSIHAGFSNYQNSLEHKKKMLQYSHSYTAIVITRDRDGGRVVLDSEGNARMEYTISKHEQKSMLRGVLDACDVHMMAGAIEISTVQVGVPPFRPSVAGAALPTTALPETTTLPSTSTPVESIPHDLTEPSYLEWKQKIEKTGCGPYWCTAGSAHQMGSCRLSSNPKNGALDPEGRVWGTKNLWVADASTLPEASGVNPMITTMATSRGISRNIAKELGVEIPQGQLPAVREAHM
ncbi:hypothetical protein L7F22_015973 [Adiantum nelumboides]|nr:hypothetical protein [Adiantum nelumboides]